jgi:hypothetical protein
MRILPLVVVMATIGLGGVIAAMGSLCQTTFDGQQLRLREIMNGNALFVESVAALMDGRIWVESKRGRGSTSFVAPDLNEASVGEQGTST